MVIQPFSFTTIPYVQFGVGSFRNIGSIVGNNINEILLITGESSFKKTQHYDSLTAALSQQSTTIHEINVSGEPSPELVDSTVETFRSANIETILSIGGGSVLDAGKAISAMLTQSTSVIDYLEGVGTGAKHDGRKIRFIAVPTTAGTGSEATKNAVLSRVGPGGFKKSLRHNNFVPDIAVIDPELMLNCPPDITASCGMDAFTQLLEAYVSTKSNPMTDALAYSGLGHIRSSLVEAYNNGSSIEARTGMAYASFISGLSIANAGLGIVHGMAGAIGGCSTIPHGVVCGSLMSPAVRITLDKLLSMDNDDNISLQKYAQIGRLFSGKINDGDDEACDYLLNTIDTWSKMMGIPSMKELDIPLELLDIILDNSANRNNPVALTRDEMRKLLTAQ